MGKTNGSIVESIDAFLAEVKAEEKSAAVGNDTQTGGTSHPITGKDDGTQPATEGERSAENEADVKSQVPSSVNTPIESTSDKSTDDQGTTSMDADEVKGDIQQPKATKEDPGTSLQGAAAAVGEKYAGASSFATLSNQLLAAIACIPEIKKASDQAAADYKPEDDESESENSDGKTKSEGTKSESTDTPKEKSEDDEDSEKMAEAQLKEIEAMGEKIASVLAREMGTDDIDLAADVALDQTVKAAQDGADAYCDYIANFALGLEKAAMGMGVNPDEITDDMMADGALEEGSEEEAESDELASLLEAAPMEDEALEGGVGEDEAADVLATALEEAGVAPEELAGLLGEAATEGEAPEEEIEEKVAADKSKNGKTEASDENLREFVTKLAGVLQKAASTK